jgi:hypothetical protein
LSGNFPINLQIVLKDASFLADVAFVIGPKRFYSDRLKWEEKHNAANSVKNCSNRWKDGCSTQKRSGC